VVDDDSACSSLPSSAHGSKAASRCDMSLTPKRRGIKRFSTTVEDDEEIRELKGIKLRAEIMKIEAETEKFQAETEKLRAETAKIND